MNELIRLFIFVNLLLLSFSIVPLWNFEKSTVNLLSGTTPFNYEIKNKVLHDNLRYILKKTIQKKDGSVSITRTLTCQFTDNYRSGLVVNQNVDFEDVESIYTDKADRYYICPKGSYHVLLDYGSTHMKPIVPSGFVDNGNWELRCYYQYDEKKLKKLFVFYLNKEEYVYYIDVNTAQIYQVGNTKFNILSYRWTYIGTNNVYPMFAVTAKQKIIKIEQLNFKFTDTSTTVILTQIGSNGLFTYTQSNFKAFMNEDDDEYNTQFYYISYDSGDINLVSGYTNNLGKITSYGIFTINHNTKSPLEFTDRMSLQEIDFIPYTKYIYYKLYNEDKNKYYYGLINIELNKVIFNTDEQIIKFIHYSKNAMLAITSNSAYKICAIYNNNDCSETCSNTVYYNVDDKNVCKSSYTCSNYKLIPNDICVNECDQNLFYSDNQNNCGLCRDFEIGKPYKMINNTGCIASKIDNTYYINEDLKIISCNDKYSYINGQCLLTDCYSSCATCSIKSSDSSQQKCLSCKSEYTIFYNNNCLKKCPSKTYQEGNTCVPCKSLCASCNKNGCTSCFSGYYLNTNTHSCEKCHSKCATCSSGGNDTNNNCLTCKNKDEVLDNGSCLTECGEKKYKTSKNICQPCKSECASCDNGVECKNCITGYYFENKACLKCDEICDTCSLKSNNCSSCKNEFYLIKGGEYEINCVENCPNDTVKYEENKTCLYVEYNTTKTEEQGENKLDLFFWGFILGIAFLLLLLNMIFFCRFCCCKKGEDNLYKEIQTELSEDLVIN